jgi:ribosomal protein S30
VPLDSPTPSIPPTPTHASTPRRQNKPSKRTNKADEHLRVINVNFQSAKTKQHLLENLIGSTKTDVIFGTETWLDLDNTLNWFEVLNTIEKQNVTIIWAAAGKTIPCYCGVIYMLLV